MDRQRLGVREGLPGLCPPVPCCVGVGVCWQHPSDTAGLRTPGSSAQLARRPPAHLEPFRQVQAAAHGTRSSEGRAARCCSAGTQASLGASGVPLLPTRATPGRAAVPTHSPAPSPEGLIPRPRHWDAMEGPGCRDQLSSRAGARCRTSHPIQDG